MHVDGTLTGRIRERSVCMVYSNQRHCKKYLKRVEPRREKTFLRLLEQIIQDPTWVALFEFKTRNCAILSVKYKIKCDVLLKQFIFSHYTVQNTLLINSFSLRARYFTTKTTTTAAHRLYLMKMTYSMCVILLHV